ncbi:MAG: hypothetical protein KDN19_20990 [Verrucomicrobiae bacterium]|nr:hypothetical protein [Verrucomicrobiae bacterium]
MLIAGLVIGGGAWWVKGKLNEFTQEFVDKGMVRGSTGQVITIDKAPTEPTFYVGQVVRVRVDTDVEIGIVAQTAELYGTASEKVYFRGQVIQIKEGGHLEKGLDVKCQVVQNVGGKVEGGVTGDAQVIQPDSLKAPSP